MQNLPTNLNFLKKNKEVCTVLIVTFILILLITFLTLFSPINKMGDTGLMYSALEFINKYNFPYISWGPTLGQYMYTDSIYTQPITFFTKHNFNYISEKAEAHNAIKFHSYFIAYLMAPFAKIFSAPSVVSFMNAFSFVGVLSLSYLYLRKYQIPILISFITIFSVSLNHAWSHALFHQPYFDRLYLIFSLALILFTVKDKFNRFYFSLFFLLSSIIVEKLLIFNFIFFIAYLILYHKDISREKVFYFLGAAILSLLSFLFLTKFYLHNFYYERMMLNSFSDFIALVKNISSSEDLKNKIFCFIVEISPFLVLPLFFAFRFFLISLAILLPNILFTVGGAEKVGFYSHYHSVYFSFLVFGFIISLINLYNSELKFKKIFVFIYLILTIVFYLFFTINEYNQIMFRFNQNSYLYQWKELHKSRGASTKLESLIIQKIPISARLSSSEIFIPYLYKYENVSFFPYNYEDADFLLVNYREINSENIPYFMTLLGDKHNIETNKAIYKRLKLAHFDFENPLFLDNGGMIIKKIKP